MKKYKTFRIMHWDHRQELWLPVKDYEGLYEVSNFGRVKSLERKVKNKGGYRVKSEKIMSAIDNGSGYLTVLLSNNYNHKRFLIHRLVAQAFLSNPLNLPQVNHKDENPLNNRAENLEWCTAEYNNNYGHHNEKMVKTQLNHPSMSKPVLQYTSNGELVREWSSAAEAERLGGFYSSNISNCCLGKRNTHKGYIWQYKDEVA